MSTIPNLYRRDDPEVQAINDVNTNDTQYHEWYWVYLNGDAEKLSCEMATKLSIDPEDAEPDDLFCSDQPMPEAAGEYQVKVYGRDAIAVLAMRGRPAWLQGRVALLTDAIGLNNTRNPDEWR